MCSPPGIRNRCNNHITSTFSENKVPENKGKVPLNYTRNPGPCAPWRPRRSKSVIHRLYYTTPKHLSLSLSVHIYIYICICIHVYCTISLSLIQCIFSMNAFLSCSPKFNLRTSKHVSHPLCVNVWGFRCPVRRDVFATLTVWFNECITQRQHMYVCMLVCCLFGSHRALLS